VRLRQGDRPRGLPLPRGPQGPFRRERVAIRLRPDDLPAAEGRARGPPSLGPAAADRGRPREMLLRPDPALLGRRSTMTTTSFALLAALLLGQADGKPQDKGKADAGLAFMK